VPGGSSWRVARLSGHHDPEFNLVARDHAR
jgi:hypothetical protein